VTVPQWAYGFLSTILAFYKVDCLVSFGYTLKKLPPVACTLINLKDEFRRLMPVNVEDHLSRGDMARMLNINVDLYEPSYPRSHGLDTCRLYQAIWTSLSPN